MKVRTHLSLWTILHSRCWQTVKSGSISRLTTVYPSAQDATEPGCCWSGNSSGSYPNTSNELRHDDQVTFWTRHTWTRSREMILVSNGETFIPFNLRLNFPNCLWTQRRLLTCFSFKLEHKLLPVCVTVKTKPHITMATALSLCCTARI